jgi:molybdate transport system ATP-binding protein
MLKVNIKKKLKEFDLDVDFSLENGCLGILGASGCGKSMTLKSIAGIVKPDEGYVYLNDKYLYNSKDKINLTPQKRNVGYLFQNYALFPNMTVEKNISVGAKKDKQKVKEMIEKFNLSGLEKRYPRQLSGGQQQRVALARILAYQPDVILLDEPFSAMDSHLKEKLRLELARTLNEYNGLSILVTHDRDEAYSLCNKLLLLDQGHILAYGDTKEIFDHPKNVKAAKLTGCKNISRIEKIDSHHVKALDFNNIILETNELSDDIQYIGIRAHDFIPLFKEENHVNLIKINNPEIVEMPFEWYITLDNGIWWKTEKNMHNHEKSIPTYLSIDPKSILLLEK